MAHEFTMPDLGEGLAEARITAWLVAVGDAVAMDQPVVEVETDKATTEIPAPVAGTVLYHGAAEDDLIEVGHVLFVVGEPGESWPGAGGSQAAASGGAASSSADRARELVASEPAPSDGDAAPIVGTLIDRADVLPSRPAVSAARPAAAAAAQPRDSGSGRRMLSPLVRRLAIDLGVDIDTIAGSGPGGRISREDVLRAASAQNGPPADVAGAPAVAATPRPAAARGEERVPLTRLRRTIAENLSRSWREIPHVSSFYEADATNLLATRAKLAERHGTRIPIDALVIAATVPALRRFPEFNAVLDGDTMVVHHHHDIGIAVDAPEGLVVAVIRDAGARPLMEVAMEVLRLGEAAKKGALTATDVGRQTFTISNIGAVAGGGPGTPIIPYGTSAILAVGRATDKPVVSDGAIAVAPVMPLSFSFDHRIADGATARRFMSMVVENLTDLALALG